MSVSSMSRVGESEEDENKASGTVCTLVDQGAPSGRGAAGWALKECLRFGQQLCVLEIGVASLWDHAPVRFSRIATASPAVVRICTRRLGSPTPQEILGTPPPGSTRTSENL
ncbi:hypothetical protein ACJZ2D_002450 [Fusarium nematophilum]